MLVLDDLTKSYGDKEVLRGLSLTVLPGELYGFCGANGSGKTTSMRIVLGLADADRGSVTWNGTPMTAATRNAIGYMPEERGLYDDMRPVEQLAYFARLSGVDARTARRRGHEWVERLGVVMGARDTVGTLSLGNQQKVQLAAALIHDPQLLILDEPFSGLDPVATQHMSDALRELSRAGVPIMFSSHQLELVERLCDRVGIVSRGRVVEEGSVSELRRSDGRSRVRLVVHAADPGWTRDLAGVEVLSHDGPEVVLTVPDTVPLSRVLDVARAAGEVVHLARHEASLSEIFRGAVAA